jgi:DNA polymerase-3 subunit epsilon
MRLNESFGGLMERLRAGFQRRFRRHAVLDDERLRYWHTRLTEFDPGTLLERTVSETRFVVLDTETTGFHAYGGDEIVSIAMMEMQGLERTGREFHSLVDPGRPIPPESSAIHGIRDDDVDGNPGIVEILDPVLEFAHGAVLVGHHVAFDVRFLNKTLQRAVLCRLPNPCLDTMLLYTAHTGRIGHYSLEDVADACDVTLSDRHTAAGDVRTAAGIFVQLVEELGGGELTLGSLIRGQYQADDGTRHVVQP